MYICVFYYIMYYFCYNKATIESYPFEEFFVKPIAQVTTLAAAFRKPFRIAFRKTFSSAFRTAFRKTCTISPQPHAFRKAFRNTFRMPFAKAFERPGRLQMNKYISIYICIYIYIYV